MCLAHAPQNSIMLMKFQSRCYYKLTVPIQIIYRTIRVYAQHTTAQHNTIAVTVKPYRIRMWLYVYVLAMKSTTSIQLGAPNAEKLWKWREKKFQRERDEIASGTEVGWECAIRDIPWTMRLRGDEPWQQYHLRVMPKIFRPMFVWIQRATNE